MKKLLFLIFLFNNKLFSERVHTPFNAHVGYAATQAEKKAICDEACKYHGGWEESEKNYIYSPEHHGHYCICKDE